MSDIGQLKKNFFLLDHIQYGFNEDVLQLLAENNSEFPDSDSSGEEGDEVYPYNGPSFRADDPEFSSSDDEIDKSISDPGKLIF